MNKITNPQNVTQNLMNKTTTMRKPYEQNAFSIFHTFVAYTFRILFSNRQKNTCRMLQKPKCTTTTGISTLSRIIQERYLLHRKSKNIFFQFSRKIVWTSTSCDCNISIVSNTNVTHAMLWRLQNSNIELLECETITVSWIFSWNQVRHT